MPNDEALRQHLLSLLKGGNAHVSFEEAIKGLPVALRGKTPRGAEHSPWRLVEHLRIAQRDIWNLSQLEAPVAGIPQGLLAGYFRAAEQCCVG